MPDVLAILKKEIGDEAFGNVDEAILEYVCDILADDTITELEDMQDAVGPLLLETGCIEDEAAAMVLVEKIFDELYGERMVAPTSSFDVPKKLEGGPVRLATKDEKFMQTLADLAKLSIARPGQARVNPLISVYEDAGIDAGNMTDADIRKFRKQEKRAEKSEKKELKRQKLSAVERDAIIERLTRAPVVIHNSESLGLWGAVDIHLKGISMDLGGMVLLEDTDVSFVYGRRYGLVGRNGVGKTTFMKHLVSHAFQGFPQNIQVLHIEQEVEESEDTILQVVLSTDVEREALLREEKELVASGEESNRLSEIYERLEEIDASSAPARAATILSGLGFTEEDQTRPTSEFSGGWRMRVSLAMALFIEPELLLLDEPTNHLDLHAVLWLENYLQSWSKTLIVVSHAREFLNNVVTDIFHFHDKTITRYKGDYTQFEEKYAKNIEIQNKQAEAQDKARAHIQSFVDRFRANAKRASMVQSRIKALERMAIVSSASMDPSIKFTFKSAERLPPPCVQLVDVSYGYPKNRDMSAEELAKKAPEKGEVGRFLFSNVNFSIDMGSRICLVGPNGAGKSTLGKIILDELVPVSGFCRRNGKCRIARFSQHHIDGLNMKHSPLEFLKSQYPDEPVQNIRKHLGSMGVIGSMALQPIYTLSGGQKSRVAIANMMFVPPHILLLDEPTNHLDLDTVEALILALTDFEGGLFIISHDEHLITAICDELWILEDGALTHFKGDFEEYKKMLKKRFKY